MAELLRFWLVGLVVAVIALPLAFQLFRRFPDAGAGLSFPLGLITVSLGFFLLRVARLLPEGPGGAVLAILLLGAVAMLVARRDRRFLSTLRRTAPHIAVMFGLFTVLFLLCAAVRSYVPDIGGTEQPMDFMYLNAVVEAESYPPEDPWFAGESLSYYYFGYVQAGVLTMASGVATEFGYNLALPYFFASAGVAIASLALGLARWVLPAGTRRLAGIAAGVAVALLLFAGSLSAWFHLASAHGAYDDTVYRAFGMQDVGPCEVIPPELVEANNCHAGTGAWYPDKFWWWFDTTRVIPGTITEFPAFSFLLGDLHPHVTALPGLVLVLALAAAVWRGRSLLDHRTHLASPTMGLLVAALLAVTAFQNTWDAVAFPLFFAIALLARNLRQAATAAEGLKATVGYLGPLALAGVVLLLPWVSDFSSQANGLHAYRGAGTTPGQLILQWGPVLLAAALAALPALRRPETRRAMLLLAPITIWIVIIPLVAWLVLVPADGNVGDAVRDRGAWGWLTLLLLGGMVWLLASAAGALLRQGRAAGLVAGAAMTGVLLLYGSELLLIADIFFGSVPRLNTVFKLSYEAWVLLSLAGAVGLAWAASRARASGAYLAALVPVAALGAASLLFLVIAVPERTNGFDNVSRLDGLATVAERNPDEYALLRWVRDNAPPDAVIAEAPGNPYSDDSRISARSGRSTVIGWVGHERQWRGGAEDAALNAELSRREQLVNAAYLAGNDPAPVQALHDAFGVEYVVVGSIELGRYPANEMTDFASFLDLAFESGPYRIYRMPTTVAVPTS